MMQEAYIIGAGSITQVMGKLCAQMHTDWENTPEAVRGVEPVNLGRCV